MHSSLVAAARTEVNYIPFRTLNWIDLPQRWTESIVTLSWTVDLLSDIVANLLQRNSRSFRKRNQAIFSTNTDVREIQEEGEKILQSLF